MSKTKQDVLMPSGNQARHIYTVSELTQDIKLILESAFSQVWVEGEVSNFTASAAGHFYFSLKDSSCVLPAVMFGRLNKEVKFKLENGLKVVCFGKISCYGPRGCYQIIVERIEPKGIGSLQLALEQLKEKLEKEGLFSQDHKRPIPYLPSSVGIVTSPSGAAIKDILRVLDRRFSAVRIIINPAKVQGEGAREDIARAIRELNAFNEGLPPLERIEVMIVGRGGGSIEDLWAFNEEIVARAIYNSRIPVISAVGHERDWTIADLVADLRVPTPSVAAELVIPKKEDLTDKLRNLTVSLKRSFVDLTSSLKETLDDLGYRLGLATAHSLELSRGRFDGIAKKLGLLNPAERLMRHQEKTRDLARQIQVRLRHFFELRESELYRAAEQLSSLSPLNILSRGYSITFALPEGSILKEADSVKEDGLIKTRLHKGEIISRVQEVIVKRG